MQVIRSWGTFLGVISVLYLIQRLVSVHSLLPRWVFGLIQYSCSFTPAVLNGLLFPTFHIPKYKIIVFPKLLLRKVWEESPISSDVKDSCPAANLHQEYHETTLSCLSVYLQIALVVQAGQHHLSFLDDPIIFINYC